MARRAAAARVKVAAPIAEGETRQVLKQQPPTPRRASGSDGCGSRPTSYRLGRGSAVAAAAAKQAGQKVLGRVSWEGCLLGQRRPRQGSNGGGGGHGAQGKAAGAPSTGQPPSDATCCCDGGARPAAGAAPQRSGHSTAAGGSGGGGGSDWLARRRARSGASDGGR